MNSNTWAEVASTEDRARNRSVRGYVNFAAECIENCDTGVIEVLMVSRSAILDRRAPITGRVRKCARCSIVLKGKLKTCPYCLGKKRHTLSTLHRTSRSRLAAETARQQERIRVLTEDVSPRRYATVADLFTRGYSQKQRDEFAKSGVALPSGAYPINSAKDLKSALILFQSGHGNDPKSEIKAVDVSQSGVEAGIHH